MCTSASVHARGLTSTTDLWLDAHPAHGLNGSGFEEAQFLERALGIIASHDPSVPLFLYYATHLVHSPLCVPPGYLDKFAFIKDADDNTHHDRQFVAAMVNYLDDVVGSVAEALKDAGLWDNTLMVWSSDNGAAVELTTGMKSSYPLRGGYTTNWEGGVRADAFVNGGLLPARVRGTKLEGPHAYIHLCDWYATFCGLARADPHDAEAERRGLPPVDSLDMWPMISGRNLTSPRTEILFTPWPLARGKAKGNGPDPDRNPNPPGSVVPHDMRDPMIIIGEWKLLVGKVDQCWWQGPRYPNGSSTWDTLATWVDCTTPTKRACLFNIIDDPTEHSDVSEANPDVVTRMLGRMKEVQRTVYDPHRGDPEDEQACAALESNGGFWGPWKPAA